MKIKNSIIASIASILCISAEGVELELQAKSSWQAVTPGEFSVRYSGKGWPWLAGKSPKTETGIFYRLSWEGKSEDGIPRTFVLIDYKGEKNKKLYLDWNPTEHYQKYIQYFPGETGSEPTVCFSMNPGPTGKVSVKNIKLEALTPSETEKNLLPDGDFESGNIAPVSFSRINESPFKELKIVQSPAFLSGRKSLELSPETDGKFGIASIYLPIRPGKKVELRFWAKADSPAALRAIINFTARINKGGKHLYASADFKLGEQWREFRFLFDVPTDTAMYPALEERMAKLQFSLPQHQRSTIWLDNIEFLAGK